jgi:phospholipase C
LKASKRFLVVLAFVALVFDLHAQSPTGTIADVRHVVIFMQENRSFDHYFGSLKGVRGFDDRNALLFQNKKTDFYQPRNASFLLPFHITEQCLSDLPHDWASGHLAWNLGKWDKWVLAKGTTTMAFHNRSDLAFYYALAEAFTICDAYHCSVMGPTNPNRLYLWTGMIDPSGTGGGPVTNNAEPAAGFTWTTYPERLQAAGVTWKIYQQADNYDDNALAWFAQYINAAPGTPLYDRGRATVSDIVTAFQNDVTSGLLPQVSWIIAPTALSEHPPYSPASGEWLTKQLLNALASNPVVYNSTVFILNYDEDGGLFDHVPPPVPRGGTPNEFVNGVPIGLGVRVPLILISPWTRGGYLCSQVFDHTSVLRFLETWTGVQEPNISAWRRLVCGDLTSAFDFKTPRSDFPTLPNVTAINCSSGNTPSVPVTQTMPVQEPGTLIARPLPYQPNAYSSTECGMGTFHILMTNSGSASVHYAIYLNAYGTEGPYQYDVQPMNSFSEYFSPLIGAGGFYDVSCYGPNGFQRRFAGNVSSNCNQIEIESAIDPKLVSLVLTLRNSRSSPATYTITNGYSIGGPWVFNLPANTSLTTNFPADDNNGWYDLTVTVSGYNGFLRRLSGHIETFSPRITASLAGTNLSLTYPDWANGYSLEFRTNLAAGSWVPVSATPAIVGTRAAVTLSNVTGSAYFRLRH